MTHTIQSQEIQDTRPVNEVALSVASLLRSYDTVAHVVGVKQSRTVKGWAENGTQPANPAMAARLRIAEKLALTVQDKQRPWVSGAWLIGCNPHIGERSPAEVIKSLGTSEFSEELMIQTALAADHFANYDSLVI